MTDVRNVAAYILALKGQMEALKLQKLAYYCQAWNLAWTGQPLFPQFFQAWANGPVCRELYDAHYRQYWVNRGDITGQPLTATEQRVVDKVITFYGSMSPQQLSDLTHSEEPWQTARRADGAFDGDRSEALIDNDIIMNYYRSLARRSVATAGA